jgi:hypothetical protein
MGHDPGGFRVWWRALTGSDETLENAYLMRLAGRFSRRVRGYAKAQGIPVIDCPAGQRKHELAEQYLAKTKITHGLFLVLVGRAKAPVWDVTANHHIERKKPIPYVNHYSFHIVDREWGHLTIKVSGHPPFPAQVILNGHEYVACQARKAGIVFTKEGNCFTSISDAAGLAKIADTLSEHRAIGRLSQVCERWIYRCVCFALDFDEQKRSGFRYQYSNYQIEYSRNLVFQVGGHMEQVFQALIDRSRAPLDLKTIKTILGYRHRPKYRRRAKRWAEWEVAVERPAYDLTVFKLHCGKLTLKIYTKGERVLRIEVVAHNTRELKCGRLLNRFPEVVCRLKAILERFADALSCIDQCFIAHMGSFESRAKLTRGGKATREARPSLAPKRASGFAPVRFSEFLEIGFPGTRSSFRTGSLFGAGGPFFVPSPAFGIPERAEGVKGPKHSGARRRAAIAQLVFRSALTPEHAQGRWTARRALLQGAPSGLLGCLGHGEVFLTFKIQGPSPVQMIWTLPRSNSHSAVALGDLTP